VIKVEIKEEGKMVVVAEQERETKGGEVRVAARMQHFESPLHLLEEEEEVSGEY
jgi:hypothetical protein